MRATPEREIADEETRHLWILCDSDDPEFSVVVTAVPARIFSSSPVSTLRVRSLETSTVSVTRPQDVTCGTVFRLVRVLVDMHQEPFWERFHLASVTPKSVLARVLRDDAAWVAPTL